MGIKAPPPDPSGGSVAGAATAAGLRGEDPPRGPDGADAFVSYSRVDSDFVRQLVDGLEASGKRVWIDWEDIPPSVDWFEQISAGIEGADSFVYVLSPDSIASEVCRRELDHAVASGKRILPVLAREVESNLVPDAAGRINWIICERPGRLQAGIRTLVEQIETDLPHVRGHTRWGQAALEWERHGRDASYLLRGSELEAATQWLSAAAGLEPAPTALQSEFVLRSRQAATRRQRQLLAGVSVALVVSIVLAIFALLQRSTAIDQRNTAIARELGVQAERNDDTDPELSLLLAAEAVKAKPSAESEDVLRTALVRSHVRARHDLGAEILGVDISPNGELYLASTGDSTTRRARRGHVYHMDTHRRLSTFPADTITAVVWDPLGRRLAVGGADGVARVHDARTGRTVARLNTRRELVLDVEWSPDGRLLALSATDVEGSGRETTPVGGVAQVWDVAAQRKVATLKRPGTTVKSRGFGFAALAWRGKKLFTGGGSRMFVWRTGSWRLVRTLRLAGYERLSEIRVPLAGDVAVTESSPGRLDPLALDPEREAELADQIHTRLWDLRTGRTIKGFRGLFREAAINGLGTEMAVEETRSNAIEIYDIRKRELRPALTGHEGLINSLEFAGLNLVSSSDDGTVRVWDTDEAEPTATLAGHAGEALTADLELGVESLRVISGGADGTVRSWSVFPEPPAASHRGEGEGPFLPALSPDGDLAVSRGRVQAVDLWDAKTGKIVRRLLPGGRVVGAVFARGGDRLVTVHARPGPRPTSEAVVWDTETWRRVARLEGVPGLSESDRLVSVGSDGSATVSTLAGERIARLRPGHGTLNDAVLSDGGDLLLTVSEGKVAQLWSLPSGRLLHTLRGHGEPVNPQERDPPAGPRGHRLGVVTGDFDASGERAATAGADGTVRVWDVGSGRLVRVMKGHTEIVSTVEFSPDGSRLLTGSPDGTARVWRVATGRQILSVDYLPPAFRFLGETQARWTSDGRYFLTDGVGSQTVSLWRADSGLRVVQAVGELANLRPGGHELITSIGIGARSAVYRCAACAGVRSLLAAVPARTTRELSKEERVRYLHEAP